MKLLRLLKLPFAIIADVATLGGTVNDAYWSNGKCSYTTKFLRDSFLCK